MLLHVIVRGAQSLPDSVEIRLSVLEPGKRRIARLGLTPARSRESREE